MINLNRTFRIIILIIWIVFGFFSDNRDWAYLSKYEAENASLRNPDKNENRVVFMGNSITRQWKKNDPDFFKTNPYICRGISGQTTPQMLFRFRQDVIDLNPKIVIILGGTNDIAFNRGPSRLDLILKNLAAMTELAKENNIKVILCSVLPVYRYPKREELKPDIEIPKLNRMIIDYCKKTDTYYLDFFTPMADYRNGMKAELTTDGVHCTLQGYKLMEHMVQEAIGKVLK